ncbi:hypothetical protein J6590_017296 [Homalodisca vitripennis]|nr:hypothetical protein J6590_017296 [Homalodisca vitripennis]
MSLDERERIDDHTRKHAIYLMTTFTRGSQFLEQLKLTCCYQRGVTVTSHRRKYITFAKLESANEADCSMVTGRLRQALNESLDRKRSHDFLTALPQSWGLQDVCSRYSIALPILPAALPQSWGLQDVCSRYSIALHILPESDIPTLSELYRIVGVCRMSARAILLHSPFFQRLTYRPSQSSTAELGSAGCLLPLFYCTSQPSRVLHTDPLRALPQSWGLQDVCSRYSIALHNLPESDIPTL